MTLQPGCRFVVAPHFHLTADWSRRLLVGAGVQEDGGGFFPLPSWRPPTGGELLLLVGDSAEPAPAGELENCVCLFQLPGHLRSAWWDLLDQAAEALADCRFPGFESIVAQIVDFLAFKNLHVPEGARCDLMVSLPGQRSVPWGPEPERRVGLRSNLAASVPREDAQQLCWPRLWGGINLGDEETSLVLMNLSWPQLDAELCRRFPNQRSPLTVGEVAGQFLRSCSDYPPMRLIVGPGEGFRLPRTGVIVDTYLRDKQQPDVLFLISQGRH
jgi:hypothetical protein